MTTLSTYKPFSPIYSGSLIRAGKNVMIVDKVNPKNFLAYDEAGRGWRVPRVGRIALPEDTKFDRTAYDAFKRGNLDAAMDAFKTMTLGSVVEFVNAKDANKFPGTYVVVGSISASNRIRIAKLGGDGGRYVTASVAALKSGKI